MIALPVDTTRHLDCFHFMGELPRSYALGPFLFFVRYLDAKRKGGIARFVNHSCDPTCRLEQWTAMGQPRCAVFSLRGMEAGEVGLKLPHVYYSYSTREVTGLVTRFFCASPETAVSALPATVERRIIFTFSPFLSFSRRVDDDPRGSTVRSGCCLVPIYS